MAMAPTAAPAAAAPMDMPPDDMEAPAAPTVLYTIMDNHDGTVTLIEGDEPEEAPPVEMGAAMAPVPGPVGAPGAGMPPPPGAGAPMEMGEGEAPVGDVYEGPDGVGEMLKVIMQGCDQAIQAGGGGGGDEEADMMDSFGGGPV